MSSAKWYSDEQLQQAVNGAIDTRLQQNNMEKEIALRLTINKVWHSMDEQEKHDYRDKVLNTMSDTLRANPHPMLDAIVVELTHEVIDKFSAKFREILLEHIDDADFHDKVKERATKHLESLMDQFREQTARTLSRQAEPNRGY